MQLQGYEFLKVGSRHQNCFLKFENNILWAETQWTGVIFLWRVVIFSLKILLSNRVCAPVSAASLSIPSSIKAQKASSRPAVCLEPRLCRVQTAERSGSTPPLSLPPLSSIQLGAIILLLCVSVMGKRPTSPLERNWQTIIWGGEELRHSGQITQASTEGMRGGLIRRGWGEAKWQYTSTVAASVQRVPALLHSRAGIVVAGGHLTLGKMKEGKTKPCKQFCVLHELRNGID